MPIATPEVYAEMLDRAKEGGFAYPAINCTSSETVNAALRGFAEAGSDGIIQFSTGGAEFASGTRVKDMVTGAVALAEFAHVVAEKYPVNIALHTDHCPKDKLDAYVRPLIALSQDRVNTGQKPLFQSHMWDGSAIDLDENLEIAEELLEKCAAAKIVLEVEIGVVGGEEDGVVARHQRQALHRRGRLRGHRATRSASARRASTCSRPPSATCTASTSRATSSCGRRSSRRARTSSPSEFGLPEGSKPFDLVFHGGSGSSLEEIREALSYGVVKMNVDTDTQYAFTRPIAEHMFSNYDGVLKVDGEVGNKKAYDPRSYLKAAETGMAARVVEACEDLLSAGQSLGG